MAGMAALETNCVQTQFDAMDTLYRWVDISPCGSVKEAETITSISSSTQTRPSLSSDSLSRLALLSSSAPCKVLTLGLTGSRVKESRQSSTIKSTPKRLSAAVALRRALPPPPRPCRRRPC